MTNRTPTQKLMNSYWASLTKAEKAQLAEGLDTSVGYLRQVFKYGKQVGPQLARAIGDQTPFAKERLRPDVFGAAPDHQLNPSPKN
ncbi:MAG: hypothetical protein V7735_25045 [Photobacterium frigidiphilum]